MHLVSISKFPFPRARSKKPCTGSKKEGATVQKKIQPNVSAYNNGVPPPPFGGKVREVGARVQKTETEVRNN